jgi:hypothetical protein
LPIRRLTVRRSAKTRMRPWLPAVARMGTRLAREPCLGVWLTRICLTIHVTTTLGYCSELAGV